MNQAPHEDLDALFAGARQVTADDLAAAEGAVLHFRAARGRSRRLRLGAWLAPLLATAAVAAGVLAVQTRDLPSSAAYELYQQASGSGW